MSYSDTTSTHDELIQINLKTSNELKKLKKLSKKVISGEKNFLNMNF